jgi:hypothetical protein
VAWRGPSVVAQSPALGCEGGCGPIYMHRPTAPPRTGKALRTSVNRLRTHVGPLWPYFLLIAIPAGGFILPDVFGGHLLMTGDNAQQNYPLHVLVGSMLRHGQLPFWDPYIFSGAPLLADFNAGAFYPLIGLFVILPDRVAWIALEVVLFAGIAIGMYAFLRALRLSAVAGVVAAATFAFSGVVLSQVNHVDMTEGFVALPWMLLAVLHIVRDGRWRWSIVLGIGLAVVILGGAPEAMLDETLFVIAYAAISAGLDRTSWWRVLTRLSVAAALGLSLAAIEWLPGLNAIANSQRSGLGGGFASTGSYPPADGLLAVVPYLYGGYRHLGEASFFSHYNLPEIGVYVGILPVIALVALLRPGWPSRLPGRDRLTWYLVGLFALLLALGANTPLEHVFNDIPFYGHQRLQSRNMIGVSAAMCVLFAGWLDRQRNSVKKFVTYDRVVGCVPFVLVLGLASWAFIDPDSLIHHLARATPSPSSVHTVREATIIALGFTATASVVVVLRSIVPRARWLTLVGIFVAADLGMMVGTSQLLVVPSNAVLAGTTQVERSLASNLSPGGRFDVYDPQGYSTGPRGSTALPDDNILANLPSVGGYASIVNGDYNDVTETHTGGDLNIASLGAGKLNDLDLQDLVTVPQYFLLPVEGMPSTLAAVQQTSEQRGKDPVLPFGYQTNFDDTAYPSYPPPRATVPSDQTNTWFFGENLAPTQTTLLFTTVTSSAEIRFGKVSDSNAIRWGPTIPVPANSTSVTGRLPRGDAAGLALQVVAGQVPPHQALITVDQQSYELDGSLSAVVHPGPWHYQGSTVGYSLMQRTHPPHPIHVAGTESGPGPKIEIISSNTKTETVRVHANVALDIVRDVAWDSGWQAEVSVNGGSPQKVPVTQSELVQDVHVPAGDDVITFAYRPPHLLLASLLSAGGLVVLAGVVLASLFSLRRRVLSRRGGPG